MQKGISCGEFQNSSILARGNSVTCNKHFNKQPEHVSSHTPEHAQIHV